MRVPFGQSLCVCVRISMCMYVYVRVCTSMYVNVRVCMYVRTYVRLFMWKHDRKDYDYETTDHERTGHAGEKPPTYVQLH